MLASGPGRACGESACRVLWSESILAIDCQCEILVSKMRHPKFAFRFPFAFGHETELVIVHSHSFSRQAGLFKLLRRFLTELKVRSIRRATSASDAVPRTRSSSDVQYLRLAQGLRNPNPRRL